MTKSKSPKSDAKRPTKSAKKPATKRVAAPKKAPKPSTKKPASKKPRGKTAVFEAPREPAPVPTIDSPPTPETEAPRAEVILVEKDADGREPVPSPTLVQALRYVHAVVPKEDGLVFYTHGADGEPLVSGHDPGASFTHYLPLKAVWELDAAVPRKDSVRFLKLLQGLPASAMVRVYRDGRAVIRHDTGQPEIVFALGDRVITDAWQPPAKGSRPQSEVSLRMDAGRARKACAVPEAIARSWSSADGIEWIDVSNAETGATIARAVIAENGHDLYVSDPRQTEIGGSRTAGGANNSLKMAERAAVQGLRDLAAEHGVGLAVEVNGVRTELIAPPAPTAAAFSLETDAVEPDATAAAPTPPAPPAGTTRLSLSAMQWRALTDEGRARLAEPEAGEVVGWRDDGEYFVADVADDLVSLVHATGDELGVVVVAFFADDSINLGAQAGEAAPL